MSSIIQLGEHHWKVPEPTRRSDILFINEKKEDQFWRRDNKFPRIFYDYHPLVKIDQDRTLYDDNEGILRTLSKEDTKILMQLQNREYERIMHGVHFMNNGEVTYLTGGTYSFLQWGAISGYLNPFDGTEYGTYRQFQAHYGYFLKLCEQDAQCAGSFTSKPKKTGITLYVALAEFLAKSITMRGRRFGMMSKTKEDCISTNFMYYKYGFKQLPAIFKPALATENDARWVFDNPKSRPTASKRAILRSLEQGKGYNTEIFAAATVNNAFDGPQLTLAWYDEFPKYKDPSPDAVFKGCSESVKLGNKIYGKNIITSYPPEEDNNSYREAKKIYEDSALSTRNSNTGRTKTQLYKYHISSLDSGEEEFDRYGKTDRERTRKTIIAVRKQLEDNPSDVQAHMRRFPMTEQEAWQEGGGTGSKFPNIRLAAQKDKINERLKAGDLPYVEGDLQWLSGKWDKEYNREPIVKFVELTEQQRLMARKGKWRMYGLAQIDPATLNEPIKRKYKDRRGNIKPNVLTGCIGAIDPTDYVRKSDVKEPSNCAFTISNLNDIGLNTLHGKRVSNKVIARYLNRPENPKETYEDIVKGILFFGCYVIVESNKTWLITMLKEDGLQNFLLVWDKEKGIVPYSEYGTQIPMAIRAGNSDIIDDMCREGNVYLATPENEDEPDNMLLMDDEILIEQLMQFDENDTRKYDLAMCWLWNRLAMKGITAYRQKSKKAVSEYDSSVRRIFDKLNEI